MKDLQAVLGILTIINLLSGGNAYTAVTIDDGLVARYEFNGNALDSSGNGFNGSVNGAVLTSDRFGNSNSAYYFAGNGEHISVSASPNLHSTGAWSSTVWFNFQAGGLYQPRILTNGTVDLVLTTTDGSPIAYAAGWNYHGIGTPYSLNAGTWYNMAAVCDGTYISLYLNGLFIATDSNAGGPPSAGFGTLGIGSNLHNNTDWYSGKIDEIRLYNRALTALEVFQISNVPEPSSLSLLALGGLVVALRRRKK